MLETADFQCCEKIATDHPSTNGHFEGNPILPGAMTFEYVRQALKRMDKGLKLTRIVKAKFTHSLKPGEELHTTLVRVSTSQFRFQCTDSKNNLIVSGEFCAEG
jgi:3-hydroxymyristoyl/3-hydroxydecanoyl-(acyl carrier protein) dehydratase